MVVSLRGSPNPTYPVRDPRIGLGTERGEVRLDSLRSLSLHPRKVAKEQRANFLFVECRQDWSNKHLLLRNRIG